MKENKPEIHRARYERFGGIVSCIDPPFLAWVDRDYMRRLGYEHSSKWEEAEKAGPEYLSAPTEVHFSVTNRCDQHCSGCYMNSSVSGTGELTTREVKLQLEKLRSLGVFHVALGGGEAFEREDFGEIVSWCREIGLVPNLTTSGQRLGLEEIRICGMMGQVNVSMDGIGARYGVNGRHGNFEKADASLKRLRQAGIKAGINCVVSGRNYPFLEEVVSYAMSRGLSEIEFLKYKPSGRGRDRYDEYALSQAMIRGFYPMIEKWSRSYGVELKMDCSFIPALVHHKPPKDALEKLAVTGCDGGNLLLSMKGTGTFSGCSFVENDEPSSQIEERWHTSPHLMKFRRLEETAAEPCRSCEYLEICRCGCRAVALHKTGDFSAPDPECPRVFDYSIEKNEGRPVG